MALFHVCILSLGGLILTLGVWARFLTINNKVPYQIWGFVIWAYVLCNGVLVNGFLKHFWGRARPVDIKQFGGASDFTSPLVATGECSANCSFVSATTTAVALMCFLLFALVAWRLNNRRRMVFISLMACLVVVVGGTRIAMGRHFLSDVVFATLLSAISVNLLFDYMKITKYRPACTWVNIVADIGAFLRPKSWRKSSVSTAKRPKFTQHKRYDGNNPNDQQQ